MTPVFLDKVINRLTTVCHLNTLTDYHIKKSQKNRAADRGKNPLSCRITKMKKMKKKLPLLTTLCLAIMITSCQEEDFKISSDANQMFHVKNGDYLIPVLVRGNTEKRKIILYIQGGPGLNTLDFATIDYPGWKNTLEKEYAVAYYEQRGMGNMQGNFGFGESVLDTYLDDVHKVATFLEKAYDAEIILLGHSFGGSMVYEYILKYGDAGIPQKYIASNGPASTDAESDMFRWHFRREFLLNTANLEISRGNNVDKWGEVLQWLDNTPVIEKLNGPDPYALINQWNKYVNTLVYNYYPEKDLKFRDYTKVLFSSPYNPLQAYLKAGLKDEIADNLLREEEALKVIENLEEINPQSILLITGRYDDICPPEELTYIYDQISSPQKQISIIDFAGHDVYTHQPTEFFNVIKSYIK